MIVAVVMLETVGAVNDGILPVPIPGKPMDVLELVQSNTLVLPVKFTAGITDPEQTFMFGFGLIVPTGYMRYSNVNGGALLVQVVPPNV